MPAYFFIAREKLVYMTDALNKSKKKVSFFSSLRNSPEKAFNDFLNSSIKTINQYIATIDASTQSTYYLTPLSEGQKEAYFILKMQSDFKKYAQETAQKLTAQKPFYDELKTIFDALLTTTDIKKQNSSNLNIQTYITPTTLQRLIEEIDDKYKNSSHTSLPLNNDHAAFNAMLNSFKQIIQDEMIYMESFYITYMNEEDYQEQHFKAEIISILNMRAHIKNIAEKAISNINGNNAQLIADLNEAVRAILGVININYPIYDKVFTDVLTQSEQISNDVDFLSFIAKQPLLKTVTNTFTECNYSDFSDLMSEELIYHKTNESEISIDYLRQHYLNEFPFALSLLYKLATKNIALIAEHYQNVNAIKDSPPTIASLLGELKFAGTITKDFFSVCKLSEKLIPETLLPKEKEKEKSEIEKNYDALPEHIKDKFEEKHPNFLDPIFCTLMFDPVIIKGAEDGISFNRTGIEKWLESNSTHPTTKQVIKDKTLIPTLTLRNTIHDAVEKLIKKYNEQLKQAPVTAPVSPNVEITGLVNNGMFPLNLNHEPATDATTAQALNGENRNVI
ncbi:MAG: U-box domain-containing protein [Gammaproteobacteria bacterium]